MFFDVDNFHIGKGLFEQIWMDDERRAERGVCCTTDLRTKSIEVDKWNKMDTGAAKYPFTLETLAGASFNLIFD